MATITHVPTHVPSGSHHLRTALLALLAALLAVGLGVGVWALVDSDSGTTTSFVGDGKDLAIITRNRYGALVLNTDLHTLAAPTGSQILTRSSILVKEFFRCCARPNSISLFNG